MPGLRRADAPAPRGAVTSAAPPRGATGHNGPAAGNEPTRPAAGGYLTGKWYDTRYRSAGTTTSAVSTGRPDAKNVRWMTSTT
ncbi:hypothetical protein GCM10010307_58990 [Streptomyces vastus]|uniref:Uncharacterized protein n=1 Tax=Streptomyces vastus TaxID=285451 RepID=A0ABP6DT34_9ACTN